MRQWLTIHIEEEEKQDIIHHFHYYYHDVYAGLASFHSSLFLYFYFSQSFAFHNRESRYKNNNLFLQKTEFGKFKVKQVNKNFNCGLL